MLDSQHRFSVQLYQFYKQDRKGFCPYLPWNFWFDLFSMDVKSSIYIGHRNEMETNFGSDIGCTADERQYARKRHFKYSMYISNLQINTSPSYQNWKYQ